MATMKKAPANQKVCRGFSHLVGATGFEPATSCSRRRAIHYPTTTFCGTLEGNRASVPEFPDIDAALSRKKLTPNSPRIAYRPQLQRRQRPLPGFAAFRRKATLTL